MIEQGSPNSVRNAVARFQFDMLAVDSQGQTPLHLAIALGKIGIAIALLENPLNDMRSAINAENRSGYTPLALAVEKLATDSRNLRLIKALIAMGGTISVGGEVAPDTHANAVALLAAKGDVAAAHTWALKVDLLSFEKLFAGHHAALRRACEEGDTVKVKALMDAGVDASFVLMRLLEQHSPLSAARVRAVRYLIAAGVDLSSALNHAVAANSAEAVRTLLLLGAPGEPALIRAAEAHDLQAMVLLVKSGVKAEGTLINQAKNGDVTAVRLMLGEASISDKLDKTQVLMALTAGGCQGAVRLLIDEGVYVYDFLLQQLRLGNKDEAKVLIRAGVNVSGLLRTLAMGAVDHPNEIESLGTLILLDVDSAPALYDMAKEQRKTAVKILIAARATIDDALLYAPVLERADLARTLAQAYKEVARTGEQMASVGDVDATLASKIIVAQDYIAGPIGKEYKTIIQAMTMHTGDDRRNVSALLYALEKVDWVLINKLVDADGTAASEVLMLLARLDCLPLARLLLDAGAEPYHVIVDAADNNNLERLSFLIRAGSNESTVLANLLMRPAGNGLAQALIQRERLDVFKTLKYLAARGEVSRLKQFIPAITDGQRELIRAAVENDRDLMGALIGAGVDIGKTVVLAISNAEIDAAKWLVSLGTNIAAALAQALAQKRDDVALVLLSWGADLSDALGHATRMRDRAVMARLVDLIRT
ncbi:hypothetical protein GCM10027288_54410 [Bordetella tumbae]|uniref:ankyrin repeat domain-containing protein n=1 Tax=Bordetella tumbae TaxID=1649139 RepID=UPI0039EE52D5